MRAKTGCEGCGTIGRIKTIVHGRVSDSFCTACHKKCSKEETEWLKHKEELIKVVLEMPISAKAWELLITKEQLISRSNRQENMATAALKRADKGKRVRGKDGEPRNNNEGTRKETSGSI